MKYNTAFIYKFQGVRLEPYIQAGVLMTILRSIYNHYPFLSPNYSREITEEGYIHPCNLGFGFFGYKI